jgi:hypothetical protein
MGAASRRKGVAGEREVAAIYQAAGLAVRGLEASGDHLVVCAAGLTVHSEVKRAERVKLPEWLRQAESEAPQGTVPVVAFRQNGGRWYAALPLDHFAALLGTASDLVRELELGMQADGRTLPR